MKCAECLADEKETPAVTVVGGAAVCADHAGAFFVAVEEAAKRARLESLRP